MYQKMFLGILGIAVIGIVIFLVAFLLIPSNVSQNNSIKYDTKGCPAAGQTILLGVNMTILGLVDHDGKQVCGVSITGEGVGECGPAFAYIDFSAANPLEAVTCKTQVSSDHCNFFCSNFIEGLKPYLQPGASCPDAGQSFIFGISMTTLGVVENNEKQVCGISLSGQGYEELEECGAIVVYVDLSATNPQEGVTCSTQVSSDLCDNVCSSILQGAEYWSFFKSK